MVKTPTAVLVAGLLALVSVLWLGSRGQLRLLPLCVALLPLIFFALAMGASINIGVRYILPVYPFLYVVLAFVLVRYSSGLLRSAWPWTLAGLFAMLCAESLMVYPHDIAFFNCRPEGR